MTTLITAAKETRDRVNFRIVNDPSDWLVIRGIPLLLEYRNYVAKYRKNLNFRWLTNRSANE